MIGVTLSAKYITCHALVYVGGAHQLVGTFFDGTDMDGNDGYILPAKK
jgi:hypothetical protein